jgi:hypothetical protein
LDASTRSRLQEHLMQLWADRSLVCLSGTATTYTAALERNSESGS